MRKNRYRRKSFVKELDEVQQELSKPTNGMVVLMMILVSAFLMVGLVWEKVRVTQMVQDIDQLEKQLTYLRQTNEKLKGQVLSLSNETRIVTIAREKLGMIFPPFEFVPLSKEVAKAIGASDKMASGD
ncbi:MAG: cell division protein FtsL [candidate division KSB1 bacterium]|nr:cell division protein FtsL [candidate division KSB1 bacterium]MDZ7339783.1 cell division protein FtsL [candidate division KSB1 bacterium]